MGHVFRHHQFLLRHRPGRQLQQRGRQVQPRALFPKKLVQRCQTHVHRPHAPCAFRRLRERPPQQLSLRRNQKPHLHLQPGVEQTRTVLRERVFRHRVRTERRIQRRLRTHLFLYGDSLRRQNCLVEQSHAEQQQKHRLRLVGLADAPALGAARPREPKGNRPQQRNLWHSAQQKSLCRLPGTRAIRVGRQEHHALQSRRL